VKRFRQNKEGGECGLSQPPFEETDRRPVETVSEGEPLLGEPGCHAQTTKRVPDCLLNGTSQLEQSQTSRSSQLASSRPVPLKRLGLGKPRAVQFPVDARW
jgi:hypothetical protein